MTLTTPVALLLLLVLIPIAYLGWPRQRYRRVRDITSLTLRVTIVTLLVLALAGVQIVQSADRLSVIFVVDVSDSVGQVAQTDALDFVSEAMSEMAVDDVAGVIVFGGDAQVARSLSNSRELGQVRVTPAPSNTDFAEAIRLALALFPDDAARRMVLLSDGVPTVGDTQGAVQLATAAGVEISYVPLSTDRGQEVQVRDLRVPAVVTEEQPFDMTVTISSDVDTPAQLTVLAGGDIVHTETVDLRQGTNNYTITLLSGQPGFRDFFVRVEPEENDGFYQNNQFGAFTRVEGDPRVLVVSNTPEDTQYLLPALEESGVQVETTTVDRMPTGVAPLTNYDSVVLVNVSALDLSIGRMEAIESYVGDLGGGLVAIGGPDAYGPGGYFQTPLEDVLPVEMQITDQERLPSLTIAYLIDRSGSMGATSPRGIPNIELAKNAIVRSIDLLQPRDRAAVASFDFDAYWVAEFQNVNNNQALRDLVNTLRPSGGTNIRSGMQLVARDIVQEEADLRHIILLTDGGADSSGLVELSERLYEEENVTTSVVSIGIQEAEFLARMAEAGNGNYHHIIDADNIPTIFTLETVLATRSYIIEEEGGFTPSASAINPENLHPILNGIQTIPAVRGYVATTARPTAQTILRGPEPFRDPLLAAWQYGLGRSVAFTSDATARWAADWVTWDDYARFWSQAVRWTMTEGANNNLETQVIMEGEQARVVVDARDSDGAFLNGLSLESRVVFDPEQPAQRVQLRQVAPGRYEGIFIPEGEGAHFLRVTDTTGESELNQTTGWVNTYSAEYQIRQMDEALLEEIAIATDGRSFIDAPGEVFTRDIEAADVSSPLAPWLLLIALVLLPVDIAVRRLIITRSDLQRLGAYLRSRVRPQGDVEASAQRLSALKEARDRARGNIDDPPTATPTPSSPASPPSPSSPNSTIGALRQRRDETANQPTDKVQAVPPPTPKPRFTRPAPQSPAEKPAAPDEESNIGARLLKKRRGRADEQDT